jgi:hypothetical protein
MGSTLTDEQLVDVLQRYLTTLQGHPSAEEMISEILTEEFETGFVGGQVWKGLDGLRDFLGQRDGFFDEKHTIEELLDRDTSNGDVEAHTRLRFFLRSWQAPHRSPRSTRGIASTNGGYARSMASGASPLRWSSGSTT